MKELIVRLHYICLNLKKQAPLTTMHVLFFCTLAFFSIDDDILLGENDLNHAFDIWKVG